jgi:hypothetical protein
MGLLDTTTALPTEQSWGAALQQMTRERTMPSWERVGQAAPPKDHKVTHYEKRGNFDALLQRYHDPKKERIFRDTRDKAFDAKLARCRTRQPKYDIVTHQETLGSHERAPKKGGKPKPPDSKLGWNIISHERKAGVQLKTSAEQLSHAHGDLLPASWKRREYDLVSNKYTHDRDQKLHADREQNKHSAQRKFRATRDFDLVKVRYHDDSKEQDFQQQRSHLASIAGAGQLAKQPPAMQYREGAAYNLVSHEVKDPFKLEMAQAVANSGVASKVGAKVEEHHKHVANEQYLRDRSRALARFSKTSALKEQTDGRHHDFDVVTGESFYGRGAKFRAPSRLSKAPSTWDRMVASGPAYTGSLAGKLGATSKRVAGAAAASPAVSRPASSVPIVARASPRVVAAPTAPPSSKPAVPRLNIPAP